MQTCYARCRYVQLTRVLHCRYVLTAESVCRAHPRQPSTLLDTLSPHARAHQTCDEISAVRARSVLAHLLCRGCIYQVICAQWHRVWERMHLLRRENHMRLILSLAASK